MTAPGSPASAVSRPIRKRAGDPGQRQVLHRRVKNQRLASVGSWGLRVSPGTDLRIVVYTVVSGSQDASKLELLKVAGTQALAL
jgi:hypothetical protein